ncbi:LysR family transcriptional regulator [Crossiella cryophila]|uniref:DNA-binding transcriptional LysR family regulator n=1 Tax=Crossiella cryophila TaxID=43355 RepID=A0A7W7CIF4_9PSEU|nr:LysR family transcriptional regulator [Crossiella cryophila]MBB4680074.1 DNA-binding transcriptional LysR family regulator [Crossiella cryophila]
MTTSLSNVDLNLLIPLNALLVEQNVTRAAERVQVGQPAMSASLARLRRIFDDPLLVKDGRAMVLTPLAESLVQPVAELLAGIGVVLGSAGKFDPENSTRVFAISASDYISTVLLRPLIGELIKEAPRVRIAIGGLHAGFVDQLRRGRCDMLIWPPSIAGDEDGFPRVDLFTDTFVAVVDKDNHEVGDELSAEQLGELPYVMICGPRTALADTKLNESGVHRNVVATVETFVSAMHLLPGTRMVTIVQRRLADFLGPGLGLRTVTLRAPMPELSEAMYWHPRSTADPAHRWLRERVREAANRL